MAHLPTTVSHLLERYADGERDFQQVQLRRADLFRANLHRADLFRANLRRATLSEADLSDAHLSGADLAEADLAEADLSRADLAGAKLTDAKLAAADLTEAKLSRANLSRADLTEAKLSRTDLAGADLSFAQLTGADLSRADLSFANLTYANLAHANLTYANLSYAKLAGAYVGSAFFGGTLCVELSLRDVCGLDAIVHGRPSSLDLATLQRSRGRLPMALLRGCGLADWQIEMVKLHDLALRSDQRAEILYEIHRLQEGAPIVFHSVFISYSTADEEFCVKLHADLQTAGVRCWFAPHDMQPGDKIHEQVERAIDLQDRLLLVLSEASMSSKWVKTEIANARKKEDDQRRRVLFPIGLVTFDALRSWKLFDADAGTDTAREVREYFIPDFSEWRDESKYRRVFEGLVKALRAVDAPNP